METYKNKGSLRTPTINFDLLNGLLEIKGRSIPENSIEFYKPLVIALDDYILSPKATTIVTICLEYFNTNSSRCILEILKKLAKIHQVISVVTINWYYEEDDILEAGEDYQKIIDIPFKMISVG